MAAHDATTDSSAMKRSTASFLVSTSTIPMRLTKAASSTMTNAPKRVGSSRLACASVASLSIGHSANHVHITNRPAPIAQPASGAAVGRSDQIPAATAPPTTMLTRRRTSTGASPRCRRHFSGREFMEQVHTARPE
ncbi:Uncharacterised protein [Mycobacteroides abscessus subsp. abscessus]|nr:Uncharacterised protein [Mycobacteroides abscessus subsp. abscessus]